MSAKQFPVVRCRVCRGTGFSSLTPALLEAYKTVKRLKSANTGDVIMAIGWKHEASAINNRLRKLYDLKLLARERKGAHLFYSIAPAKP